MVRFKTLPPCRDFDRLELVSETQKTLFTGVFFIIPCVDIYEKIDMRTQTFDVPPQEVMIKDLSGVVDDF